MVDPDGTLEFHPLVPERWNDFESLFGPSGAYGGCWCTWWRQTRAEFDRNKGDGNRRAMRAIVESGEVPGLLAYLDGVPAGWVSVAPRDRYSSLERSPVLKRLDEEPVWSIVCLYVGRTHRGKGLAEALVEAACGWARENGARIVEAYPTVPRGEGPLPPVSSYMGVPSLYEKGGFEIRARPSPARAIVRRDLPPV